MFGEEWHEVIIGADPQLGRAPALEPHEAERSSLDMELTWNLYAAGGLKIRRAIRTSEMPSLWCSGARTQGRIHCRWYSARAGGQPETGSWRKGRQASQPAGAHHQFHPHTGQPSAVHLRDMQVKEIITQHDFTWRDKRLRVDDPLRSLLRTTTTHAFSCLTATHTWMDDRLVLVNALVDQHLRCANHERHPSPLSRIGTIST